MCKLILNTLNNLINLDKSCLSKIKNDDLEVYSYANITLRQYNANEECPTKDVAKLNDKIEEEIKDLVVCMTKYSKKYTDIIIRINYDDQRNKNYEQAIVVEENKIRKIKIPKNLVLNKVILICVKQKDSNVFRSVLFAIVFSSITLLGMIGIWYRKNINVSILC